MAVPRAAAELESEGAKLFESPTSHTASRTVQSLGAVLLGAAAFEASLLVPGVTDVLGVGALEGSIACGLVILGVTIASVVYWSTGFSRLYLWAEYAESVLTAAGYSYVIQASGRLQNLFWLLYLGHVFNLGSNGTSARNGILLGAAPTAIALGFGLKGDTAGVAVSLAAGAFGVALYFKVARSFDELEDTRRREVELKGRLARLRVAQERDRIARDLHDGVGAELASLIWRVRRLASDPTNPPSPADVEALERRVLDTIDELRDIVLALRPEPMSWDEVTTLLRERCQEMCGAIEFELTVEGSPDRPTLDAVFPDLIRIVLELVRNAVRHAVPTSINVRIEAAGGLRLCVSDDGRGFQSTEAAKSEGGLGNVRRRVEDLGGRMDVTSGAGGTRIGILLPSLQGVAGAS